MKLMQQKQKQQQCNSNMRILFTHSNAQHTVATLKKGSKNVKRKAFLRKGTM